MKHPHASIINQWLEDTTRQIEMYVKESDNFHYCFPYNAIEDHNGLFKFRIKPKPDEYKKPTLGLKPKYVHNELRIKEIQDAIERYKESDNEIPKEWMEELNELQKTDEYEHLRQAIRDGKKIEILNSEVKWVVLNLSTTEYIHFIHNVNRYRIHDPYRELKEAQDQGKRIVWRNSRGEFISAKSVGLDKFDFGNDGHNASEYKIVEHDDIKYINIPIESNNGGIVHVKLKITKSGIDGTIKAEVINE